MFFRRTFLKSFLAVTLLAATLYTVYDVHRIYDTRSVNLNDTTAGSQGGGGAGAEAVDLAKAQTAVSEESAVDSRLSERKKKILEMCEGRQFSCYLNATLTFHMYPFHDYNATVCTIPKAGSSTWRNHLRRVNKGPPMYLPIRADPRREAFLSRPVNASFGAILSTAKIITVRHPLTRLVSCYRNKYKEGKVLRRHHPDWERMIRKQVSGSYWPDRFRQFWLPALVNNGLIPEDMHLQLGLSQPIDPDVKYDAWVYEKIHAITRPRLTFVQFLRHVIATFRANRPDSHWSQYHRDCCPCLVNYDFVTRVETLTEDLERVFKVLGIPSDPSVSMNQNRKDLGDPYKDLRYYRDVPLEIRNELFPFIKTDLEMFGYKLPAGFLNTTVN